MSPSLNPVGAKRGSVKDMFYVSFLLNFTSLLRRYKKINSTKEEIHILTLNEKKSRYSIALMCFNMAVMGHSL
jgi:hypothetical protein